MPASMPRARTEGLLVRTLDHECLVYGLHARKALCLGTISAEVWRRCDGVSPVADVARDLGAAMNTDLDEDLVWATLRELERNALLDGPVAAPPEFARLSRRALLLKYALPALAVPLVAAIAAPTPAHAQSCLAADDIFDLPPTEDCIDCIEQCKSEAVTQCCSGNGAHNDCVINNICECICREE